MHLWLCESRDADVGEADNAADAAVFVVATAVATAADVVVDAVDFVDAAVLRGEVNRHRDAVGFGAGRGLSLRSPAWEAGC